MNVLYIYMVCFSLAPCSASNSILPNIAVTATIIYWNDQGSVWLIQAVRISSRSPDKDLVSQLILPTVTYTTYITCKLILSPIRSLNSHMFLPLSLFTHQVTKSKGDLDALIDHIDGVANLGNMYERMETVEKTVCISVRWRTLAETKH